MSATTVADLRVWVGCLGCYNAGALVGSWVDALEAESLEPHDHLAAAGISLPACGRLEGADERWCLDLEGFEGFIPGECSPAEAQRVAEALEAVPDYVPLGAVAAWVGNGSGTLEDLSAFDDDYAGEWDSEQAYAEDLADSIGAIDSEARWPNDCIDWERATRELFADGLWSAPAEGGGVHVFRS